MICPECQDEMDELGHGFDPATLFAWSEWQCFKCGAVVLHTEDADDNQLDYGEQENPYRHGTWLAGGEPGRKDA